MSRRRRRPSFFNITDVNVYKSMKDREDTDKKKVNETVFGQTNANANTNVNGKTGHEAQKWIKQPATLMKVMDFIQLLHDERKVMKQMIDYHMEWVQKAKVNGMTESEGKAIDIKMLEYKNILNQMSPYINQMSPSYSKDMERIPSVKEGMRILERERSLLKSHTFNWKPSYKTSRGGHIIFQSDYEDLQKINDNCDFYDTLRIKIFN
eukprot:206924_1